MYYSEFVFFNRNCLFELVRAGEWCHGIYLKVFIILKIKISALILAQKFAIINQSQKIDILAAKIGYFYAENQNCKSR